MKVLLVTVAPPWPPMGGASLRSYNFIRHLGQRHQIDLVCYASAREELQLREALGPLCRAVHGLPPPEGHLQWRRALRSVVSPLPDLALRFHDPAMRHVVQQLMASQDFDVAHVVGLEATPWVFPAEDGVRPKRRPKIVFDELNAEYLLQDRAGRVALGSMAQWPRSLYSWVQGRRLRRYEKLLCAGADGVLAVAEEDQAALRELLPGLSVEVVPNGVDTQRYRPRPISQSLGECLPDLRPGTPVLLFTGTMDFRPNVDAVTWFAREVFPQILRQVPEVRFLIVGRSPTAEVQRLAGERIIVTGTVPEDLPYFHRASVYVLPMRFGAGSRLKLLQALACGLPIVTTLIGAAGVAILPGEHALVADRPGDFARGVLRLLQDEATAQRLGDSARELSLRYDWERVVQGLEAVYRRVAATPVPC